jgi:hypothetical protein
MSPALSSPPPTTENVDESPKLGNGYFWLRSDSCVQRGLSQRRPTSWISSKSRTAPRPALVSRSGEAIAFQILLVEPGPGRPCSSIDQTPFCAPRLASRLDVGCINWTGKSIVGPGLPRGPHHREGRRSRSNYDRRVIEDQFLRSEWRRVSTNRELPSAPAPRSSNSIPDPMTRSLTVPETRISPGAANEATRAAM